MNRYLTEHQKLQMFENKVLDDVNGHAPLLRLLTVLIGPVCDACWCNSTDRLHVSMYHDNMYQHSRGNQFESRSHYGLPPSFSSIYYPSSIIIQLTHERGEACSTGRDSKCIQNIGWKTQGNTLEIRVSWKTTTGTFKDWCVKVWSGFIWLTIKSTGRLW